MVRTRVLGVSLVALVCVLMHAPAWAQQSASGLTGAVKDITGKLVAGVKVEAASPALIEKVRTVFTDGSGQYKITDLPPGSYVVTFSAAGFNTLKRDGINLTAGFTGLVNGDLKVGSPEQTVTITGEVSLVDSRNISQGVGITASATDALPTGSKSPNMAGQLIPGMTVGADVGGSSGTYANAGNSIGYHGKSATKRQFDGLRIENMEGAGSAGYIINSATVQEVRTETGGSNAESVAGGAMINSVPKSGSNVFKFTAAGQYSNDKFQGDNLSTELRARGLTSASKVLLVYDESETAGGAIKKDKIWFFLADRMWGNHNQPAGLFYNSSQGLTNAAGQPTPHYTPDLNRPADRYENYKSHAGRLTFLLTPKAKLNVFVDAHLPRDYTIYSSNVAPETPAPYEFNPQGLYQATFSMPATSKLLIEAGFSYAKSDWPTRPRELSERNTVGVTPADISVTELSTGFVSGAGTNYAPRAGVSSRIAQRFSVAYITGSHAFKFGMSAEEGIHDRDNAIFGAPGYPGFTAANALHGNVSYQYRNGLPSAIVEWADPFIERERMFDIGFFAQDQWTIKKLTLNMGLRLDHFKGSLAAQHVDPTEFVPVARDFPAKQDIPLWNDINPRLGAAYDVFGNGRTALKVALGRYVSVQAVAIAKANNPLITSVNSVNRNWSDTNGNFIPDCVLLDPTTNGECGPISDTAFGQVQVRTFYQPDVLNGWGARPYTWDFSTEMLHQITPSLSVTAGYYRNWAGNFNVTDNTLQPTSAFSPYCVTVPTAPGNGFVVPGAGSNLCGLFDVNPSNGTVGFGRALNNVTQASHYGQYTSVNDFFAGGLTSRFKSGYRIGGGADWGRTVNNNCFTVNNPEQQKFDLITSATVIGYCQNTIPWMANLQVKLNGSLPLPAGFTLSGSLQNVAGPNVLATWNAPNTQIADSLGRNLSACGTRTLATCTSTAQIPLIAAGTVYEDRRTQIDMRVGKTFKVGARARLQANLDIYNITNSAAILAINTTYGPQWRLPIPSSSGSAILDSRLVQFSGNFSF